MLTLVMAVVLTVVIASCTGLVVILLIEGHFVRRRRLIRHIEDAEDIKEPRSLIPSVRPHV